MFKRGIFLVFILGLFFSAAPPALAVTYGISPPRIFLTVEEGESTRGAFNLLRDVSVEDTSLGVRVGDASFIDISSDSVVDFTDEEIIVNYSFGVDASDLEVGEHLRAIEFIDYKEASDPSGVTIFLGVQGKLVLTVLNSEDYHQYVKDNPMVITGYSENVDSGVIASQAELSFLMKNTTPDALTGISYTIEVVDEHGKVKGEKGGSVVVSSHSSDSYGGDFRLKPGSYETIIKVSHNDEIISQEKYPLEIAKRDSLIDYMVIGAIILFALYIGGFILSRKKKV